MERVFEQLKFPAFFAIMLTQPVFLIALMVVDEQFSLLSHIVNLNTTYYFVPFLGRLDVWSSWEACFMILIVVYEAIFIWSLWQVVKK